MAGGLEGAEAFSCPLSPKAAAPRGKFGSLRAAVTPNTNGLLPFPGPNFECSY